MADDVVGCDPPGPQRREDREARRDQRRLLHLRLDELVERGLEAELLEVEAGRLAADAIDLHRLRDGQRDLPAHSLLQRPLPGEAKRNLRHVVLPFAVHSIRVEPHVRPAPIPVMRTSEPSRSRPSASASPRASGIDPEDVFP